MKRRDMTRSAGFRPVLVAVAAVTAAAVTGLPGTAEAALRAGHAPLSPAGLTVGDQARPLNVEGAPLFGWTPRDRDPGEVQSAYEIVVRDPSGRTVWDSRRVRSGSQEYVKYAGPALAPETSYTWTVRTWDRTGKRSPWARPSTFDTGIADEDWQATWIRRTTAKADDYTLARKDFTVGRSKVVRARVHIAAGQQYALHLNGETVDHGPAFEYPDDGYYRTVDVTSRLKAGRPATIGALYHWYGSGQGRPKGEPGLLLRLVIDHADGTRQVVVTDGSWKVARGPWKQAPKRNGDAGDYVEDIDGTAAPLGWDEPGHDASSWEDAQVVGAHPTTVFKHLRGQETALTYRTVRPAKVTRLESGALVADFGKVIPAVPVVRFRDGAAGRHVGMHASYVLNADGTVSRSKDDNQDTDLGYGYTQRDGDQTFRPLTYVGFRYLEIAPGSGAEAGDISAVVQHNEVTREGGLRTSNAGVNAVYDLMARSALYGSQTQFVDTPTREKGQFLGDSVDTSKALMGAYGDRRLSRQAIREFIASQARYWPDGRLNAVYPNGDGKRDIPDYTEMFPGWVWDYYEQSGDASTLARAYPVMTAVAGYVRRYIDEGTGLVTNLEGGSGQYQYGIIDWPATMRYGHDMDTAARTVINVLGVDVLNATARAAETLGKTGDAAALRRDAGVLTGNINARLRRPDGVYIDGLKSDGAQSTHASQIANAYALAYGVAPAGTRDKVESYIAGLGLQMGPMTAHRLLEALADRPRDVVTRLTDTKGPGWGNILARGGTFTWESWDAPETGQSFSHPWGATSLVEVQRTLLGVTVTAPASATVRIKPPLTGLDRASGTVPLQRGDVGVTWTRAGHGVALSVDVPVNVRAEIHVPARSARDVRVSGPRGQERGGARLIGMKDGYAVFEAGSGHLTFRSDHL
ncbi:glycoside hydrolase family 78 protein [Actinomadura madurae]|uniref:family 78 glycoside hydrolase catalytic domain n=1 Tax=Actinomadura madurae TaxID=1993 RepID=UPI0020266FFA|nr:family 78 glycoside hydrolase catalytic domain [Actinomadura madurae]URM94246.1 glycoside hydrolase family 78 protein [Actinomadura madurae]